MENNLTVLDTIEAIKKIRTQKASSKKDEVRVMQAMLNDRSFEVSVYNNKEQIGTYSPAKAAREMSASIIMDTTKISRDEAVKLAEEHEFSRSEAENMIGISKQFIMTYINTGRKLPLGSRDNMNVGLSLKVVKSRNTSVPILIGKDANGKDIYNSSKVVTKSYESIKVHANCPCTKK